MPPQTAYNMDQTRSNIRSNGPRSTAARKPRRMLLVDESFSSTACSEMSTVENSIASRCTAAACVYSCVAVMDPSAACSLVPYARSAGPLCVKLRQQNVKALSYKGDPVNGDHWVIISSLLSLISIDFITCAFHQPPISFFCSSALST